MFFKKNTQYCCGDCKNFVNPPPGSKFSGTNKGLCTYYRTLHTMGRISGAEARWLCTPERDKDASDCNEFEAK